METKWPLTKFVFHAAGNEFHGGAGDCYSNSNFCYFFNSTHTSPFLHMHRLSPREDYVAGKCDLICWQRRYRNGHSTDGEILWCWRALHRCTCHWDPDRISSSIIWSWLTMLCIHVYSLQLPGCRIGYLKDVRTTFYSLLQYIMMLLLRIVFSSPLTSYSEK